jgi:MFS family permease
VPLLDPHLFRARSFSGGLVAQLGFWCGQASFFVVLALYLQRGRGLAPLQAGLVFTILAVAYLLASVAAPSLALRHGRRVIAAGALVLATGHLLLLAAVAAVGAGGSVAALAPGLVLVGAGMGFVLAPLATTILQSLEPERAGAASGALTTMQNVGNALGVAITGVIFFGAVHSGYAHAFELSVAELALTLVVVAGLARLLPRPAYPAGNRFRPWRALRSSHGDSRESTRGRRPASQLATAAEPEPAGAVPVGGGVLPTRQLHRDGTFPSQPRDGAPPRRGARGAAARA